MFDTVLNIHLLAWSFIKNRAESAWFESVPSTFQTNVLLCVSLETSGDSSKETAVTNISLFIHSSRLFLPGTLARVCGEK